MIGRCAAVAVVAAALVWGWLAFVVHYADNGNWTAPFCIGDRTKQPPELERKQRLYRWPRTDGYDGASYRLLAHDPWLTRGFQRYIDSPRMRARRILLPAISWLLAGGDDGRIDSAYVAAVIAFAAAGVFWVAAYAASLGRTPLWGLAYLLLPSTIISVDRMLTDMPMVTLLAGCLWYMRQRRFTALWICATLACLARETGVCIVIGYAGWLLFQRRYRSAAIMAAAVAPLLAWMGYVDAHTAAGRNFWSTYIGPARDLLAAFVRVRAYPEPAWIQAGVRITDEIALAGFVVGFVCGIALVRRGGPPAFVIVPFLGVAAILTCMSDQFTDVYGYGRLFSPVLLLLGWDALESGKWVEFIPTLMILSRTVAIPVHETLLAFERFRS